MCSCGIKCLPEIIMDITLCLRCWPHSSTLDAEVSPELLALRSRVRLTCYPPSLLEG